MQGISGEFLEEITLPHLVSLIFLDIPSLVQPVPEYDIRKFTVPAPCHSMRFFAPPSLHLSAVLTGAHTVSGPVTIP